MKKIEVIIMTSELDEVRSELKKTGIDFFSDRDESGVGNEHLRGNRSYRGTVYDTRNMPGVLISIVLRDINVQKTIDNTCRLA